MTNINSLIKCTWPQLSAISILHVSMATTAERRSSLDISDLKTLHMEGSQQTLIGYELSPIPTMSLALQVAQLENMENDSTLPVGTENPLKKSVTLDLEAATDLPNGNDKLEKMTSKISIVSQAAPDGGYGWFVVLAAFLVNFYVWGVSYGWGIYQGLYLNDVYKGQTSTLKIAFIGTSANAVLTSLGLFLTPIINRIGYRGTMAIGTILAPLGLVLASFSTELWHLYITQGILFGIGGAFVFSPSIALPSQWFDKHRGLATGMSVCGSGVGGLALTPLVQFLIENVGYRATLRYMAIIGVVILGIATFLAKPRWALKVGNDGKMFDKSLLSKQLWIMLFFGFTVTFGYLVPYFLMPSYAISIGLSPATGAVVVGVMSGFNAAARIGLGYTADRFGRVNTMFVCTLLAGLACLLLWTFANNLGVLMAFAVVYGGSGGGFISLFPVVTADVVGVKNLSNVLGAVYASNVFGNLLGTPLAGAIYDAAGGSYIPAMIFSGGMSVIAAISMAYLKYLRGGGNFWKMV
ncbi:major facilitator superfamily domain-containing protein [Jimgerdemannia flammicorona]|uniref:Major facilitator superfamily domain-containing protein n=1 Tax=Jimgerdemannia flammicorona TaxID=994334 RepID=A0A433D8L0_9FUNG|nr:major facilitator superfamily domain-containing protein [Jimgerdemannia flammicorona]